MTSKDNKIIDVNLEDEMKESYIDYAMSVIVGRALPDVRDGLKPVHRRILYSMYELGMTPDKPYRKSARIVGDVLGKYHPHGDTAVYDSMVRMAQDFAIRYPLVDGHGNFGSIDGDSAAAMRYTEARMSKLAMELLSDIKKDTVDFMPNFDETLQEPVVLPSKFPNLLVNGSSGIAVGMATNIPPHNLREAIDGVVALIDNPDMPLEDLMRYIKGPDFPTGGIILGKNGIMQAYAKGRGKIIIRSKTNIEDMGGGKSRIVITEIPYMVNKARLIERIAELVKEKKIEGISDIRDESDRNGMRIVIETKRDANPDIILNYLFKHTQMQETFGAILLALVDGRPKVMSLKEMIFHYIDHQRDVVTRRTKFDLATAENRSHILEGLLIALDNIDAVIKLIRGSKTAQIAKEGLIERFNLSEKQAQAILDMRLQRLTGLEREKIELEYKDLQETIAYLKSILADEEKLYGIIKEELIEIRDKYGDERRTDIVPYRHDIEIEDLIDEHDVVITLTHYGYVKRTPLSEYRSQRRGGKGITGLSTREEDFIKDMYITSTHQRLLIFTSLGRVYELKAYEIPEASRQAKGTAIVNILQLQPNEKIQAFIPVIDDADEEYYLFMATRKGIVKKTPLSDFENIRRGGIIAINLREGDELVGVKLTDGDREILLATSLGKVIRFHESDVRVMGRNTMGVKGIALDDDDFVIDMEVVRDGGYVLTVSENGIGKLTPIDEYRSQTRGGKGILTMNRTKKTGNLVALKIVDVDDDIMMINSNGIIIRIPAEEISVMGRNTQGVTLMKMAEGEKVVAVARVEDDKEEDDNEKDEKDDNEDNSNEIDQEDEDN